MSNSASNLDEHGRPEPLLQADELGTLVGFLEFHRATLEWKTRGLGADGLAARTARSAMSLGGILKHMALVEDHWFSMVLHDRECAPRFRGEPGLSDPEWEWTSAHRDDPEGLRSMWSEAVETSRAAVAEALRVDGLDQVARRVTSGGTAPSLRWILVHMIEEYARHNGHADLLRESVDGQVGE